MYRSVSALAFPAVMQVNCQLVWAAPWRDRVNLGPFFDALGSQRCAAIADVSADGADWVEDVLAQRYANAVQARSRSWLGHRSSPGPALLPGMAPDQSGEPHLPVVRG